MSVFVDTSAIFAGIDGDDAFHGRAVDEWTQLLGRSESLVTHSLVEVESAALLHRRLGSEALAALRDRLLPRLQVVEIDRDQRRAAMTAVCVDGHRSVSIVDRVSFDLMRALGITRAFAYDRHFSDAGFELVGSPG